LRSSEEIGVWDAASGGVNRVLRKRNATGLASVRLSVPSANSPRLTNSMRHGQRTFQSDNKDQRHTGMSKTPAGLDLKDCHAYTTGLIQQTVYYISHRHKRAIFSTMYCR